MEHVGPFATSLRSTQESLMVSAIALTLYDYMLLFDDEIRYVWKGRKTWIFYLYALNRVLLIGYQLWQLGCISDPHSKHLNIDGLYVQFVVIMFFLFSSDIFVTLRIYAITFGNKVIVAYFAMLALGRLVMAFVTAFIKPSSPMPLQFMLVPNSIGTAFELSAFLVIALYTYRNKRTLRFSALVYTIAVESTVYFLCMVAAQVYIQLSFNLIKEQEISVLAYGLFNPILTLRFAISLRKVANPGGGQQWQVAHFNTPHFAASSLPYAQVPTNRKRTDRRSLANVLAVIFGGE